MKKFTYKFHFKNRRKSNTQIWLANPPVHDRQSGRILAENREADEVASMDVAGNHVSYYDLAPGETIEKTYEVAVKTVEEVKNVPVLSTEESAYYLRSSTFVQINDEIRALAAHICQGLTTDEEKARALFDYVRTNFKYKYPPKERGNLAFLRTKKGDCGEFSFLYASLCRAENIPCRTVFGAWAVGKGLNAHAWNEVFLEEKGWVPVDVSMAHIRKRQFWRIVFSPWPMLSAEDYFGCTEGQRVIFSIETDHKPIPSYPHDQKEGNVFFTVNNKVFSWGNQLVEGNIPYLQPMYLYEKETFKHRRAKNVLGAWAIYERGRQKGLQRIKEISSKLALVTAPFFAGFYLGSKFVSLPFPLLFAMFGLVFGVSVAGFSLASLIRKEHRSFYTVMLILFSFTILGVLSDIDEILSP